MLKQWMRLGTGGLVTQGGTLGGCVHDHPLLMHEHGSSRTISTANLRSRRTTTHRSNKALKPYWDQSPIIET
jgi:hypothetical protein